MNARQKIHQQQLNEWAVRFVDQKASGLTIQDYCEKSGISFHKFHYWKHQLKEQLADQVLPDIAPLVVSQPALPGLIPSVPSDSTLTNRTNCTNRAINASAATVSVNGFTIDVSPDIPEQLLFSLFKAARYA